MGMTFKMNFDSILNCVSLIDFSYFRRIEVGSVILNFWCSLGEPPNLRTARTVGGILDVTRNDSSLVDELAVFAWQFSCAASCASIRLRDWESLNSTRVQISCRERKNLSETYTFRRRGWDVDAWKVSPSRHRFSQPSTRRTADTYERFGEVSCAAHWAWCKTRRSGSIRSCCSFWESPRRLYRDWKKQRKL